jgi:hypothetical protein
MKRKSEPKAPANLYELFGVCTPEQAKAISEIDDIVLDLVLLSLGRDDLKTIKKSTAPFETFEIGVALCEALGLPTGTWLPVHFHGPVPVIVWEAEELKVIQGKSVAELQGIVDALARYSGRSDLVRML